MQETKINMIEYWMMLAGFLILMYIGKKTYEAVAEIERMSIFQSGVLAQLQDKLIRRRP
jgi:hypothetical protein